MDRIVRQAVMPVTSRHFARKHGSDTAIGVLDRINERDFLFLFQCNRRLENQTVINGFLQAMILFFLMVFVNGRIDNRIIKEATEVQACFFPA